MPVAYESDGGGVFCAANNNNAITVPLPATRPVGSVLLLAAFCRLITAVAPTITGYTLLGTWTSATASGGRIWLYGRIVDGTETAPSVIPVGVTGTSGDIFGAGIVCYSGVDTSGGITTIFDSTPTTTDASGTTTCTYPALTITKPDSMIMRMLTRFRDAVDTFTPTATWNERADLGTTNRTGGQFHMQDKLATASGVQAAVTVAPSVTTASRYLAVTLALKAIPPTHFGSISLPITFGKSVAGDIPITSLYALTVLDDNPVAYYRMNEISGQPQDSSGNANHTTMMTGTLTYGVSGALADGNGAISFPGTSGNRVTAPDHSTLDLGNVFTCEAWIKLSDTAPYHEIVNKGLNAYQFRISPGGWLQLIQDGIQIIVTSTVAITDTTTWHHVVATKNGNTVRLYLDAVNVTGTVSDRNCIDTSLPLTIGASSTGLQPANAALDEVAVYSTALSESRVAAHYAAAGPYGQEVLADNPNAYWRLGANPLVDSSGNENSLTVQGTAPSTAPSLIPSNMTDGSRDFSGSNQRYTAASASSLNVVKPLTIEAWITPDVITGIRTIVRQESNGYIFRQNGAKFEYYYFDGSNYGLNSTSNLIAGNTYHVVVVDDGTTIRLYLNGVLDRQYPRFTGNMFASTGLVGVGATHLSGSPIEFFDGRIDEIAIYGTALSSERIQTHYEAGVPPPAPTYYGQIALPIGFSIGVQAQRKTFSQIVLPVSFGSVVAGRRKTLGQLTLPVIFGKEVQAQRKTFGQLLSPFIFGKAIAGHKTTFGQTGLPIGVSIFTAGQRVGLTLYGALSLPMIFSKDVRGQRKTFGQTTLPIFFAKDVKGFRRTFGQIVFPIVFTKEAVGRKNVFGALTMQTLFGKEIAGRRRTFSQLSLPLGFSKSVAGRKQTFGRVALPVDFQAFVNGQAFVGPKTYYGQIVLPLVFGKQVVAHRKTFGQITAPLLFGSASQGQRRTFSELEMLLDFEAVIKSGRIGVHGILDLDLILTMNTDGKLVLVGVILNDADDLYLGEQDILAAYVGGEQVWP